jgi:hypothetical protein
MLRSDPKDTALRWQAFLIDGFEDWLPAATVAASNMIKATARDVLRGMISDFYFPEGIQQSTDDIASWMDSYAYTINAKVRDPKTGEIVGHMRDIVDAKSGKKKRPPVNKPLTKLQIKRNERRKIAAAKQAVKDTDNGR